MTQKRENDLDLLCINTIRTLSMDAVQKANSGHPGTPMALAPVAHLLYDRVMKHNPANPDWPNRDRFILSAGHASMLLYSVLHISGYDVSLDDIRNFRQLHSKCAGHPEYGLTPGVETTTGPLGQGVATSVGMAIAEKWLAKYFNRPDHEIVDYNMFAVAGDGCMMEGVSSEAASLAGHLGLDNLVWIYDNNHITIEGNTALAFSEDVAARFMAYHWNVQRVGDANDLEALSLAMRRALGEKERPSLIIVDSHIAYGAPNKQDTSGAHGSPLGEEEIQATKKAYGWDPNKRFFVPPEVEARKKQVATKGREAEEEWNKRFAAYKKKFPEIAEQFEQMQKRELPAGWEKAIPEFPADEKGMAGRSANEKILNSVAAKVPWLVGGSADLSPSTLTLIKDGGSFQRDSRGGRNLHFGIRENAMGSIVNGLSLSKLRAYGSTFLVFSDYMRPTFRLSSLMQQPVIYVFTHDSIGVGEDGPTHQPIEHLASLRAIPNLDVIRPADANELAVLWKEVLRNANRPAAFVLTRQNLPTMDRKKYASAEGAAKGGYVLADSKGTPQVILMATGSEVDTCLQAHDKLVAEGIRCRVVSLPCWSIFERQEEGYWETVLPDEVTARVAVEAGSTFGWRRYTGRLRHGSVLGMRDFGASAPLPDLLEEFGLTPDGIVNLAKETMARDAS